LIRQLELLGLKVTVEEVEPAPWQGHRGYFRIRQTADHEVLVSWQFEPRFLTLATP
jgi:hypothetical protein